MFLHFSIKELSETLLGPKFLITFFTSLVLIIVSVYTGYRLYEEEQRWHANALAQNVQRLENLGSYGTMHSSGTKTLRAPVRMSIFVKGVDSAVGRSAMVNTDANTVLRDSRIGLNPIFAVFGDLDLAFIVKIILSLFALLFSYNAVSGERETGTLKLIFANSVGRAQYIAGKSFGGVIAILLTFLIPFLVALLMLMLLFNVAFTSEEWGRIALLMVSFSLYLIVFYMIGIAMSAITRSSMLSFLLCLFVWVLSVAVLPRVAVEVASQFSPAPSVDEVEAQRAALRRTYHADFQTRWQSRLEQMYAGGSPTREEARSARQEVEAESRAIIEADEQRIISEYRRKQLRLLRTAESFARISPTSAVTFAANRIGLTDAEIRERYLRAVERYKEFFDTFAEEKKKANPELAGSGTSTSVSVDDNSDEGGGRQVEISVRTPSSLIDVNGLPRFDLEHENVEESFSAVIPDFAVLGFQTILFFAIAFAAFLRYDVR